MKPKLIKVNKRTGAAGVEAAAGLMNANVAHKEASEGNLYPWHAKGSSRPVLKKILAV
ncbi:hypothetical protein HanRHA438_Chr13g0626611 [Helianthus annuus]|nr:hypothetical protein HanRHA438_Chr13g0626611 [Helianthus annuus]